MRSHLSRSQLFTSVLVGGLWLCGTGVAAAQEPPPPPIGGLTGTIALEGTVHTFYKGLNTIVVKTVDGFEHLFHLAERTVVHGGTAAGDPAWRGLEEGSRVIVHYTPEGDDDTADEVDRIGDAGLIAVEGVITNVDRHAGTLSIRLTDGSGETLRLTARAAAELGKGLDADAAAGMAKVVVYVTPLTDDTGGRVAHYFRRVS
jgi:hypothetical protein